MASDDIQGQVTDGTGNAVANAVVALWNQDNPAEVITTQADSNGNYIFEEHPDGDGTSQNWHLAAYDPNDGSRQFPSLHSIDSQLPPDIPDSVIHRWPIDEGSGTTVIDTVGNADGTINGPTWVTDTYLGGAALDADGTDDFVETTTLGDWASAHLSTSAGLAFTFETTSSGGMFIGTERSDGDNRIRVANGEFGVGSGNVNFYIQDDTGTEAAIATDIGGLNDGGRYRIYWVKDGTNVTDWQIWVGDGTGVSQVATQTPRTGTADTWQKFADPITFFAMNSSGNKQNFQSGVMDSVLVFDAAPTQSVIEQDYNNQPWS